MPLTRSNQDLSRDLQGLVYDLKWSAVDLMRIAERLSQSGNEHDAQAVIRICQVMQTGEDRLVGYGDELGYGPIDTYYFALSVPWLRVESNYRAGMYV